MFDNETGKAIADVITLHHEVIDDTQPYEIFDPVHTWKRKTVTNFTAKPLGVRIFDKGECVYESPTVKEIAEYCKEEKETLWDETKRFFNPHKVYVDLSDKLYSVKRDLLSKL